MEYSCVEVIGVTSRESTQGDGNIQMSSDKNKVTKVERIMIGLGRKHLVITIISLLVMATFGIIQIFRTHTPPQKQSIPQTIIHNKTTPKTSGRINNAPPLTNGKAETTKPTREDSIIKSVEDLIKKSVDDKEKTTKTKRAAPHKPATSDTSPSAHPVKGGHLSNGGNR